MDAATTEKNSPGDESGSARSSSRARLPALKSLLAFEAAARHANFTQAGAELGVTPSAISHQIQSLEDFLGVRLFLRQSRQVALTSEGKLYRHEIEAALKAIADATQRIAPQSQPNTLAILASPSFAAKWLQPRLKAFMDRERDIRVRVSTLDDPASVQNTRFDIALCYGAPAAPEMTVVPLIVERVRPLCSPALALALGLRSPSDLSRATLIHSANAVTWSAYFQHLGIGVAQGHSELWLDRSTMAIEAAVHGLGVVLESDILTEDEFRDGRLVAPFDAQNPGLPATSSYFLVTPRGYRSRRPCAAFTDWLQSAVPPQNRP
jgi:LysR family transcriptional regulator, glycine cleavage system transcriptional activator